MIAVLVLVGGALAALGADDRTPESWVKRLRSDDPAQRLAAARGLDECRRRVKGCWGVFGPPPGVITTLTHCLSDDSPEVRAKCAAMLGAWGFSAAKAEVR